jgi:RNA polymerase sigma factor (sigma-70 family)
MRFDRDTAMGGGVARFPATRFSAIASVRSQDAGQRERGLTAIVESYWKPAYKYIRVHWNKNNEDAKDLTQGFFAQAIEKGYLAGYDAAKGSFRGYLRTCLDGYVANQNAAAQRLKRGGGAALVPLDFENAEGELQSLQIAGGVDTEEFFQREWVRHLFSTAVERLRAECDASGRQTHFLLLERYDLEESADSYEELARITGLTVTTVTNHLAWARRRFRAIVLDLIRTVSGSDEEFQREARAILGGGALR